ncbi:MAG: AraC family transcriptional regulator [Anaerolineae bacterium]|nr:AraC family transcriptional regulator [Anaerolineae bacterium]
MGEFEIMCYEGQMMVIGTFFCPSSHPRFQDTGPIGGYTIVFPRTSVTITHDGRTPVVADPNVVMFYNQGQLYRRGQISAQGDLCDWFGFGQTAVIEAIRAHDPTVDERWLTPFCFTHGLAASAIYMQQRLLIHYLNQTSKPDPLFVEEKAFAILRQTIAQAYAARPCPSPHDSHTAREHRELAQAVKELLARRFAEPLSLAQIATAVYTSPFHLSRVFRQQTGLTIHHYLNQLRLRAALSHVAEPGASLTDLGLQLGYASHSHFTLAFRRAFGTAPSRFRQTATTAHIQEMSKILTA